MKPVIFTMVLCMAAVTLGQTGTGEADVASLRATAAEQAKKIQALQLELDAAKARLAAISAKPGKFAGAKGLDEVIADFTADRQPLQAVLERLGRVSELNVVVDWSALDDQRQVKRDTPISISLKAVTLRKLLDTISSLAASPRQLDYEFDGQRTLLFSTGAAIARRGVVLKMYDIRKLMAGGGGQTAVEKADQVMRNIQSNVDSGSWRDNGGSVGTIREIDGLLVITATAANHDAIAALLKQLSQHR